MTKRQVIWRFGLLSAALMLACAVAGIALAHAGHGRWGVACVLTGAAVVAAAGLGCFLPNAPVFGRVITGDNAARRTMALTFDDGPSPDVTPRVLDALLAGGVRATFFVLGRQAELHPELVRRMHDEGHEVASHGYDHALLPFASTRSVTDQLDQTEQILREAAGGTSAARLFRAPHGFRGPFVARATKRRGYRMVGWTKGVWDTALPGAEKIVERSARGFRTGAILLLHDADGSGAGGDRTQTADALPHILERAAQLGYRFVTVSEIADAVPRKQRSPWRVGLSLGIPLGIAVYALHKANVNVGLVLQYDIGWWWVMASVIANFASILLKAVVWKTALDSLPEPNPRARYRDIVPALFIGFLLNTVLIARLGEIVRVSVLNRRLRNTGQPADPATLAGTVLTEQLALGASLAILLVAMAAALSVPHWAVRVLIGLVSLLVVMAASLAALGAYSRARRRRRPADAHLTLAWWHGLLIQAEGLLHAVTRGQRLFRQPARALLAVVMGLASWSAQILGIWFALRAFGIDLGLSAAALVFFTSTAIQLFPIVPGNVGVFQLAVVAPLTASYNVDPTRALAFAIGLQVIEAVLGVGLGFVFLSREGLSLAEARRLDEEHDEPEPPPDPPHLREIENEKV